MEENNNKSNVVVKLEQVEQIQFYETQTYGSRWIEWGKDNMFPVELRELYLNSGTHQAICDTVINLTTGEGAEVENPEQNPYSNEWLNSNFPQDTIKDIVSDLKIFGFACLEVYSGGDVVKYKSAIKFRFDTMDDNGTINNMWFSNDWSQIMGKKNKPVKIPMFKQGTEEPISIYVIQLDKKGFDYYSVPDYFGGLKYVQLESSIATYHLNNIKNGFFPSFTLSIVGSFSEEQMKAYEKKILKKWGGENSSTKIMINFVESIEEAPILTQIDQPGLDDTYTFLAEESSRKILVAHGIVSPLLVGIPGGTGFGNNADELEKSYYLLYESKLSKYQDLILEGITDIMQSKMLYGKVDFVTYNPFAVTDETTKMSKVIKMTEIEAQPILNIIDDLKVKTDKVVFSSKITDNTDEEALYKFVKASNNDNIILKKLEILSKKGYVFKHNDMIKNTKDYYWITQKYIK